MSCNLGILEVYMGVSKNRGTPKWMVYDGKTLLKWMIWGYPYFWKHPYGYMISAAWAGTLPGDGFRTATGTKALVGEEGCSETQNFFSNLKDATNM